MLALLAEMLDSWNRKALGSFRRLGTTHPTTQRHIAQELNLLLKLIVNLIAPFQHEDSFTKCQIAGTLVASSYLLARLWGSSGGIAEDLRVLGCDAVLDECFWMCRGGFKKSWKVRRDHDPSTSLHPTTQCCLCFCKTACKIEQVA
jgi:hypothetical protein